MYKIELVLIVSEVLVYLERSHDEFISSVTMLRSDHVKFLSDAKPPRVELIEANASVLAPGNTSGTLAWGSIAKQIESTRNFKVEVIADKV